MPMLYFHSSLLASLSNLTIPRISMARETKKYKNLEYIVGKALGATLMFGIFFSSIFMFFGNSWSTAFYKNSDAGVYLKVLSPIVPLVYLDVVVDSLLKGMDEQFNSMKFNLADSTLRVVLVFCLLRFFGMDSYIGILFVSTIFNVSLSLGRLIKVTRVKINISERIVLPALSFYPASFAVRLFIERYESIFPHSIIYVLAQIVLSALAGGCLYYVLTYIKSLFIKSREPQERT